MPDELQDKLRKLREMMTYGDPTSPTSHEAANQFLRGVLGDNKLVTPSQPTIGNIIRNWVPQRNNLQPGGVLDAVWGSASRSYPNPASRVSSINEMKSPDDRSVYQGYYRPLTGSITMSMGEPGKPNYPQGQMRDTMLHELSHAQGYLDDFDPRVSPGQITSMDVNKASEIQRGDINLPISGAPSSLTRNKIVHGKR